MLPVGHYQVLPPLCPLQVDTAVVGSQRGLSYGSMGTVTARQEPVVDDILASPHSIQIPDLRPGIYEAILSDHPQQSMVLSRCGIPRSPRGLAWHQSSSGSMPSEDAVDGSTSQTHATNKITLPHALMCKCKHFMPNTYRGWTGDY